MTDEGLEAGERVSEDRWEGRMNFQSIPSLRPYQGEQDTGEAFEEGHPRVGRESGISQNVCACVVLARRSACLTTGSLPPQARMPQHWEHPAELVTVCVLPARLWLLAR